MSNAPVTGNLCQMESCKFPVISRKFPITWSERVNNEHSTPEWQLRKLYTSIS